MGGCVSRITHKLRRCSECPEIVKTVGPEVLDVGSSRLAERL